MEKHFVIYNYSLSGNSVLLIYMHYVIIYFWHSEKNVSHLENEIVFVTNNFIFLSIVWILFSTPAYGNHLGLYAVTNWGRKSKILNCIDKTKKECGQCIRSTIANESPISQSVYTCPTSSLKFVATLILKSRNYNYYSCNKN